MEERFFAKRNEGEDHGLNTSHVPMLSQPRRWRRSSWTRRRRSDDQATPRSHHDEVKKLMFCGRDRRRCSVPVAPTARAGAWHARTPYPDMPAIAPIGVRIGKYLDVPASARGPAVDPAKATACRTWGAACT